MHEVAAQLVRPVTQLGADGVQRVEVAQPAGDLHLRRDVAVLETVDLVQRDHDRDAEREDAPCHEPVARADPVARREDEEHDVDVLERAVHRLLHPLGQCVHRTLEAGQVDEHELPVVAVRDAEDAPSGRVGDGRRDRDLLAGEGVDERRLADVRPTRDGDEAALHAVPTPRSDAPSVRSGAQRPPAGHIGVRVGRVRRRHVSCGRVRKSPLTLGPPTSSPQLEPTAETVPGQRRNSAETVPVAPHGAVTDSQLELLRQELVGRHLDDAATVPEDHALDLHLGEPLAAAAAR